MNDVFTKKNQVIFFYLEIINCNSLILTINMHKTVLNKNYPSTTFI